MSWFQKTINLPERSRGSYLITDTIEQNLPELRDYKVGLLNLFAQHTSCALSLNENWDDDVRADMSDALDRIAPEDRKGNLYRHSAEGLDDMPVRYISTLFYSPHSTQAESFRPPARMPTTNGREIGAYQIRAHRRLGHHPDQRREASDGHMARDLVPGVPEGKAFEEGGGYDTGREENLINLSGVYARGAGGIPASRGGSSINGNC
ncbi:hypothetical protein FGG08_000075 [Glutinoglossum americanum]|uniref:Uncharacterized protein n=1 Tax=Glutinoglossum americanum TaxID=1670608 RepID=A0A9P8L6C1_9PEZI|nr:hypothetical protein FGG08_000075 [Glutinoglossum americanum]